MKLMVSVSDCLSRDPRSLTQSRNRGSAVYMRAIKASSIFPTHLIQIETLVLFYNLLTLRLYLIEVCRKPGR